MFKPVVKVVQHVVDPSVRGEGNEESWDGGGGGRRAGIGRRDTLHRLFMSLLLFLDLSSGGLWWCQMAMVE